MEEQRVSLHPAHIVANLTRRDCLEAVGPLMIAAVFAFVLYAVRVPINAMVVIAIGLVYWPLYEILGLIVEQGIIAAFRSASPQAWERFRNSFYPLLMVAVVVGLYFFEQWFWMIVLAQCVHLAFSPPGEREQREGCLDAVVTVALLFVVLLLFAFDVPQSLSSLFRFPNVSGPLVYLPGMLIIGIGYYFATAVLAILQSYALGQQARNAGAAPGTPPVPPGNE